MKRKTKRSRFSKTRRRYNLIYKFLRTEILLTKRLFTCLIVAICIVAVSYFVSPQSYLRNEPVSVTITNLAKSSPENHRHSANVLILGITIDGKPLAFDDDIIELGEGWRHRLEYGEVLISDGIWPSTMNLHGINGELSIDFFSGDLSGLVQVETPHSVQVLDLFAPVTRAEPVNYSIRLTGYNFILLALAFFLIYIITNVCLILMNYTPIRQKIKTIYVKLMSITTNSSYDYNAITSGRLDKYLHSAAAILFPNMFLFDLYNRNFVLNHIPFINTLIIAGVLSIISFAVFFAFRLIVKSYESAIIMIFLFWTKFWFWGQMYSVVNNLIESFTTQLLLIFLFIIFCVVTISVRRYSPKLNKVSLVFNVLSVCAIVFFIINFAPGLRREVRIIIATRSDNALAFMKDFNVDHTLPTPDIYWIHMDGMMSMETVETFFDIPVDTLRDELGKRNFNIYENAELYGGYTKFSLPALFSPAFYDSGYGAILNDVNNMLAVQRHPLLSNRLAQHGFGPSDMLYNETLNALAEKGYYIVPIAQYWGPFMTLYPFDRFYCWGIEAQTEADKYIRIGDTFAKGFIDLFELLSVTTPLAPLMELLQQLITEITERDLIPVTERIWTSVPEHTERVNFITENTLNTPHERFIYRALVDSLSAPSPKFTFMTYHFTHPYRWDYPTMNPWYDQITEDTPRLDLHNQVYEYASLVMLNSIDEILERNPNAVIVIQSDHGIHLTDHQEYLLDLGYTEAEILELQFSVMSAVRIPEQYGCLGAPLAPLNISRELVNRFVGENYTLLP